MSPACGNAEGGKNRPSAALPYPEGKKLSVVFIIVISLSVPFFIMRHNHGTVLLLYLFRLAVLTGASVEDLRFHRVRPVYETAVFLSGFFCVSYPGEFLTRLVLSLILFGSFALLWHRRVSRTMGGADIKMLCALLFAEGPGIFAGICAVVLLLCLIYGLIAIVMRRRELLKRGLPFLPFLCLGWLFCHLLIDLT